MTSANSEHIHGGIYGLLVGDALGVPYEFHAPQNLPPSEQIEYEPPRDFSRAHAGVAPGTWSDDGAQALCLLASLLECSRFDPDDFGQRLQMWYDSGYFAVDNVVFDVGVTTASAIRAMKEGVRAVEAGLTDQYSNGNGSLMRVLPLALWHKGSDVSLVSDAHLQSRVTHGHLRSQVCCALYCLWARRVLENVTRSLDQAWYDATQTLRGIYASNEDATAELEWNIRPDDAVPGRGTGYVVDCLRSARHCARNDNFTEAVRAAILLGHDTDTTACVTGGIVGLQKGFDAIPPHWVEGLRGRDMVEPLIQQLLSR
jgi:ADP-ribosylglycohydrolase